MVVGPEVKKFTWLLDNVEVKGIVRLGSLQIGNEIGSGDALDIEPDENYKHLVSHTPGSDGVIHCETYREGIAIGNSPNINRVAPWPIETKPPRNGGDPESFKTVTGQALKVGDHVRIVGRWLIENGHPEKRITRQRGNFRVGVVFMELHPFNWKDIRPVVPLNPNEVATERVSVAAPIYEEIYSAGEGQGFFSFQWWRDGVNQFFGLWNRLYISEDLPNFHNTVIANPYIKAPPLPSGFTPEKGLIDYIEYPIINGTGLPLDSVRIITIENEGIKVSVTVSAPLTQSFNGINIANVNDPALNRSVFQADYSVWWLPRLRLVNPVLGNTVDVKAPVGEMKEFEVTVENVGPDDLRIIQCEFTGDLASPSVCQMITGNGTIIPKNSRFKLRGRFTPTRQGFFYGKLIVKTNDPSGKHIPEIEFLCLGEAPLPKVDVAPTLLDFGNVRVGESSKKVLQLRNIGLVDALVRVPDLDSKYADLDEQFYSSSWPSDILIRTGQSYNLEIYFSPTYRNPHRTHVMLVTPRPSGYPPLEHFVELRGVGVSPIIKLAQQTLDFGILPPGDSKVLSLDIRNEGDAALTVKGFSFSPDYSFFLLSPQTFPLQIQPNTSLPIQIIAYAHSLRAKITSNLWHVLSDDPQNPSVDFRLICQSAGPFIDLIPTELIYFDRGSASGFPVFRDVYILNKGNEDLTITDVCISGAAEFTIKGLGNPKTPFVIPAYQSQKIQVKFDPQQSRGYYAYLIIESSDINHPRISIQLRGQM